MTFHFGGKSVATFVLHYEENEGNGDFDRQHNYLKINDLPYNVVFLAFVVAPLTW